MDLLLDEFCTIDTKAADDAKHPILGPNEIFQYRAFSLANYTVESAANLRWPDARHEEMLVMGQRLRKPVDWEELTQKLDALTERWQAPLQGGEQTANCEPMDFTIPTSKGRRHARPIQPAMVLSIAISTTFAVVLLRKNYGAPPDSGELWRFAVAELGHGKWRPAPRVQSVEHYQASFCVHAHLFLLDGPILRVIDLNHGEVFRTNFYEAAGLPSEVRFDSMQVNRAGVLLCKSAVGGRVVLGYVALGATPSLTILETQFGSPESHYSSIGLAPASGMEHNFLLGRTDGLIEQYELELSEETVKLNQTNCFDLFQPKISTVSNTPLKVEPGHAVQGVFIRGHRISAYTDRDWIAVSTIEGVPQATRRHRPNCPMVSQHTLGDMTACLKANGEMSLWSYSGTAASQAADATALMHTPENYILVGQQRVAMLPDAAAALLQNGRLVFIKLK